MIQLERAIPSKETINIEFKSDKKKYPDAELFEAVVAFANTDGGVIYLGVENNGEVTGVHPSHSNPETLGAYIANNTVPPVSVRAEIIEDISGIENYRSKVQLWNHFNCIGKNTTQTAASKR